MKNHLKDSPVQFGAVSVLLVLLISSQVCSLQGDNVCYRYESYTETETIPRNQTVQVLTRQWCLEIPPRCTSYRTEIKEVFVKQNVTKTRRVEFCCEGYQERRTGNGTTGECRPICRGGCIHGECMAPNVCTCEAGFGGKYCLQSRFSHRRRCYVSETGVCMPDDEIVMFDNITRTIENSYSSESTERISAEQWIKVENVTLSTTSSTTTELNDIPNTNSSSTSSEIPTSTTTEAAGQMIPNATYAESYHEYLPNNTEMSMVLTKGHSRTASNETMYELVTTTSRVEITFIDTAVKKIEDPATIINTTEEQELSSTSNDTMNETDTQLVYLESENHPVLVGISGDGTAQSEANDRQAFVTISCLLITLGLLLSVVFYMKRLNSKTLAKPVVNTPPPVKIVDESVQTGSDSNRSSDPLPDLPHVTYTRVKPKLQRNGDIEHYDVPANNSFIHRAKSSPYNYNFSINQKQPPRKYSLEHIYDEIQYPPLAEVANGTTQTDKQTVQLDEKDDSYSKPIVLT
uniref:EMI domain-containing protein n=1 Tax=Anopheles culicifacies TaxID=139723 RepID=A0A182M698_9DIPT